MRSAFASNAGAAPVPQTEPRRLPGFVRSLRSRIEGARAEVWVILGLAFLVRVPGLVAKPLWYDEAFAVLFASKGPAAMLSGTLAVEGGVAADVHPLLYYSILWAWIRALGNSPLAVRALSLLLGLGVVYLGYRLALRTLGTAAARLSGILLALSPFQVHYALEVRMYALLAALLLGATVAYRRASEEGDVRGWLAFAILSAAAQYTHNLASVYLVALSVTPVLQRRWKQAIYTLLAGGLAVLLYLPWLLRLPSQFARVSSFYWIPRPGPAELVRTLLVYVSGLPVPEGTLPFALFAALLVVILSALTTFRGLRQAAPAARSAAWLAFVGLVPPGLMFAVSQRSPVYLDRAMLPAAVCFLLWIAWCAVELDRQGARLLSWTLRGALAASFALGLWGFFSYQGFPYAPFPEMTTFLRQAEAPDEVVLHSNKITAIPAAYYAPDLELRYLEDPPRTASDTLATATQRVLGLPASPDVSEAVDGSNGVWFVLFDRELLDYAAQGVAAHPALAWLGRTFSLESRRNFGELSVYHFIR